MGRKGWPTSEQQSQTNPVGEFENSVDRLKAMGLKVDALERITNGLTGN